MVRLNIGEELFVEWRGKWMKAVVTQIDCSLVRVGGFHTVQSVTPCCIIGAVFRDKDA